MNWKKPGDRNCEVCLTPDNCDCLCETCKAARTGEPVGRVPNGRGILYVLRNNVPDFTAFCTSEQAREILDPEEYSNEPYDEAHFIDNDMWDFKFVDGKWIAGPEDGDTQTQGLEEALFL